MRVRHGDRQLIKNSILYVFSPILQELYTLCLHQIWLNNFFSKKLMGGGGSRRGKQKYREHDSLKKIEKEVNPGPLTTNMFL